MLDFGKSLSAGGGRDQLGRYGRVPLYSLSDKVSRANARIGLGPRAQDPEAWAQAQDRFPSCSPQW